MVFDVCFFSIFNEELLLKTKRIKNLLTYIFVWISSGLILGVVGYGYLHYTAMAFAVIILTLLVLFFVTNRLKHPKMILYIIAAMFFCVGIQLMDKSTEDIYDYSLEMDYSQGDIYLCF